MITAICFAVILVIAMLVTEYERRRAYRCPWCGRPLDFGACPDLVTCGYDEWW